MAIDCVGCLFNNMEDILFLSHKETKLFFIIDIKYLSHQVSEAQPPTIIPISYFPI